MKSFLKLYCVLTSLITTSSISAVTFESDGLKFATNWTQDSAVVCGVSNKVLIPRLLKYLEK